MRGDLPRVSVLGSVLLFSCLAFPNQPPCCPPGLYRPLAAQSFGVSDEDFARFGQHWSEFDPEATCYIRTAQLSDFVR